MARPPRKPRTRPPRPLGRPKGPGKEAPRGRRPERRPPRLSAARDDGAPARGTRHMPYRPGAPAPAGVIYGLNVVEAALQARRRPLQALLLRDDPGGAGGTADTLQRLEDRARAAGVPVQRITAAELEQACHSSHHQGAALRCGALPVLDERSALAHARWSAAEAGGAPPPLLVALDQVEDPRNLGAVVRSALAFGTAGLVLPRDHSAPLSAVASSASAGALERFPVHVVANLARFLEQAKAAGFWALGTVAEGGEPLAGYVHDRPLLLVLGNEGRGLRPLVARTCDAHLTIPLPGRDSPGSLNVASAAAVLLYQLMTVR